MCPVPWLEGIRTFQQTLSSLRQLGVVVRKGGLTGKGFASRFMPSIVPKAISVSTGWSLRLKPTLIDERMPCAKFGRTMCALAAPEFTVETWFSSLYGMMECRRIAGVR